MPVTRDDVLRIASLARVGVPDERVDALVAELTGILTHVEVLTTVRTAAAPRESEPMPLAEDIPGPVPLKRARKDFAPEVRDGFFLVPRLASHDDATGAA